MDFDTQRYLNILNAISVSSRRYSQPYWLWNSILILQEKVGWASTEFILYVFIRINEQFLFYKVCIFKQNLKQEHYEN